MSTFTLTLSLFAILQDPYAQPGAFEWGQQTVSVPRASGGAVDALLYYPALVEGLGAAVDPSGGPYPVITFGPGFFSPPAFYESTLRHLATHGYIVIATTSQQFNFFPDRERFIADVVGAVDFLVAENGRAGSSFAGLVDTSKIGASGHSLGGGVSIVAAARDPRIVASATLAAASLRDAGPLGQAPPPYADVEVASLDIPVSLINDSLDALIPVATNGQVIYNAAAGPKMLPNLLGGFHSGFIDPEINVDTGTVTRAENLAFARAELTSFFDLYLKGDPSAWRRQWGPERLALAGIESQLDPGIEILASEASKEGLPGADVVFELLVRNTSDRPDSFDLLVEDNEWSVRFSSDATPLLSPGQEFLVQAFVSIPSAPTSSVDEALVSARSARDGGTRAFDILRTTAVPEAGSLALVGFAAAAVSAFARRARRASP